MPLEGHWKRQTTSLRSLHGRERRILVVVVAVLVLACVGVVVASVSNGGAKPVPDGCIRVALAGVMGAAEQQVCGTTAQTLCAHPEGKGPVHFVKLAREACHKAGLPTAPEPGS